MSRWPLVAVEDLAAKADNALATGPFGSSIGSDTFRSVVVPVIRGSNLSADVGCRLDDSNFVFIEEDLAQKFRRSQVLSGDLVFTCWGTINQVGLIDSRSRYPRYVVSNKQMKLSPDPDKVDPLFLYYWFSGPEAQHQILSAGIGSSVPGFNLGQLRRMRVPLPTLSEQRSIAYCLGALDDKIELNQKTSRTLEEMARRIFQSWFVDFEPTNAKAAGATSFRGMPQAVFDELPDRLVESDAVLVPSAWTFVPIGELVEVVGGGTPSTKNPEFWDGGSGGYAFCTPKDMSSLTSPVLLETERHITRAGVEKISSGQLPVGTVLLSSRAPIGYLAISETPVSVNQGIIAMISETIPNTYILLWTVSQMDLIKARAGGTTFAEISKSNFRRIPALRPDSRTLAAFGDITRPLFDLIASKQRESALLVKIRDMLLPKLVSGEIRVADPEGASDGK